MYYSTPGALKVQGLAARKVTAGSPLNSCKLSAGFRRGGGGGVRLMALGGSPARGSFCKYPPPPPVWKEFFSWMLEAVEGNDYIVIRPGLCKTARLLVFLLVLVAGW